MESFINAMIRWGPGRESLEFRLHLRYFGVIDAGASAGSRESEEAAGE